MQLLLTVPSKEDGTPLDVSLDRPDLPAQAGQPFPVAILTHPYGPLGGNYRNNVVSLLRRYLLTQGYTVLSLNFRGSGRSKGRTSWRGRAEQQDLQTLVDRASTGDWRGTEAATLGLVPATHLLLCGYSYGAMIAGAVERDRYPHLPISLFLVSYPVSVRWMLTAGGTDYFQSAVEQLLRGPGTTIAAAERAPTAVLSVAGDHDQFTSTSAYARWWTLLQQQQAGVPAPVEFSYATIPGADHFWWTRDTELVQLLDQWLHRSTSASAAS